MQMQSPAVLRLTHAAARPNKAEAETGVNP
jgi:hypothetical protein